MLSAVDSVSAPDIVEFGDLIRLWRIVCALASVLLIAAMPMIASATSIAVNNFDTAGDIAALTVVSRAYGGTYFWGQNTSNPIPLTNISGSNFRVGLALAGAYTGCTVANPCNNNLPSSFSWTFDSTGYTNVQLKIALATKDTSNPFEDSTA